MEAEPREPEEGQPGEPGEPGKDGGGAGGKGGKGGRGGVNPQPVVITDPGPLARYSFTTLFVLVVIALELAILIAKL
jgi:hypothetical protein